MGIRREIHRTVDASAYDPERTRHRIKQVGNT